MKLKHTSLFLGGRKTLKRIVLQQLFAKAKGTNKHPKRTGRKQLRKIAENCGKLRTSIPPLYSPSAAGCGGQAPPPPPPRPALKIYCPSQTHRALWGTPSPLKAPPWHGPRPHAPRQGPGTQPCPPPPPPLGASHTVADNAPTGPQILS